MTAASGYFKRFFSHLLSLDIGKIQSVRIVILRHGIRRLFFYFFTLKMRNDFRQRFNAVDIYSLNYGSLKSIFLRHKNRADIFLCGKHNHRQNAVDCTDLQKIMQSKGAMAGNTVVFGVRGDDAWRLEDPMFRFDFVEGSREQALIDFRLKDQRVCVIPQTLAKNANLHAGDTLCLKKSLRHGKMKTTEYVEYRVAAVIDFPWVWLSKCSGVRVSAGRTAACIFAPYEQVIRDFGALENEFFWFDVEKGVTHQKIVDEMRSIAADLARKKRVRSGTGRSISGGTRWDSGINRNHVQVSTIESLNNSLLSRSGGVIDTMTQMPLVILLLSTLAVLNTMIVSVRSRRWEMGVLRACGMTRSGLVRMIAAESILMGICACIMSLASGVFYAYLALKLVDFAPMFGIIAPEMLIPWSKLFYGFALTLGVCFCAGIVPAITAGMTDTTTLLQRKE